MGATPAFNISYAQGMAPSVKVGHFDVQA